LSTPLTPTGLSPSQGQQIPVTESNTFTWQSDGTQAGFTIQYSLNISGAEVITIDWINLSTSSYTYSANSFTNTFSYKWRVKIRNSSNQESLWSEWSVFVGGSPLLISVSFPQNDLDTITSLPLYSHSFNSPYGYQQVSFQYKLYTGSIWDTIDSLTASEQESMTWDELELYGGSLIWDSGEVVSTATSIQQPPGYMISGTYWYKICCIITDDQNNTYTSDLRTFYILLDSIPQTPTITADDDSINGQNAITITNPTPDPGQVSVDYNRLYRKKLDGTWELIQDNITSGIGYDTTCHSAKQEEYTVSAVGTNGIESGFSNSAYATCELEDYWFTNLTTNATIKLTAEVNWGQMQSEREREEYQGMDEVYLSVLYGQRRFYRGNFQAYIFKPTDGTIWETYIESIRAILDVGNQVLIRTPFGDLFQVDIYDFQMSQVIRTDECRAISFNFVEVAEYVALGSYTYDIPDNDSPGYWIIDAETGNGMRLYAEPDWGATASERERNELVGLNSEFPSINYGNKKAYRSGFSGVILTPDTGILAEEIIKLRELIDSKNKKPLIFKADSGDIFLVDTYGFSFELFERTSQARKISFEFIQIGVN